MRTVYASFHLLKTKPICFVVFSQLPGNVTFLRVEVIIWEINPVWYGWSTVSCYYEIKEDGMKTLI